MKRPRDVTNDKLLFTLDKVRLENGVPVFEVSMKLRKVDSKSLKQAGDKLDQVKRWYAETRLSVIVAETMRSQSSKIAQAVMGDNPFYERLK